MEGLLLYMQFVYCVVKVRHWFRPEEDEKWTYRLIAGTVVGSTGKDTKANWKDIGVCNTQLNREKPPTGDARH